MTRRSTAVQRAAALLAALCLALGLALPTYAESAEQQPLFSVNDLETIQQTEEPTDAENETAEDAPAPTATPETAESEDETLPDIDEETDADETQADADQPTTLELQEGEYAVDLASDIAVQDTVPDSVTIYFAVGNEYKTGYKVKFYGQMSDKIYNEPDRGYTKEMTDTGRTTADGRKIFSVVLKHSNEYKHDGLGRVLFQYYNKDDNYIDQNKAVGGDTEDNYNWIDIGNLAGKIYDGSQTGGGGAYQPSQWVLYHPSYAGRPMYFKNASGTALENVVAVFYRDTASNGQQEVGRQSLGTVDANSLAAKAVNIPDDNTAYVQFTWTGGSSGFYNFCGETNKGCSYFTYDALHSCFVYNGSGGDWSYPSQLTPGNTIYFDATLSAYSYDGDAGVLGGTMPSANGSIYCFFQKEDGTYTDAQQMTQTSDSTTSRTLWQINVPSDGTYVGVRFSAVQTLNTAGDTNQTETWAIPPGLQSPCFFADDGDPDAYIYGASRSGYWGEATSVRDAESGKGGDVVKVTEKAFTEASSVKYVHSTLYDYYTDYELNGLSRATMSETYAQNQRNWVPFRQFDQAVSDYYTKNNNVKHPLYTGHFQTDPEKKEAFPFSAVAGGLNLFGWNNQNQFFSDNNSVLDITGTANTGSSGRKMYGFTSLGLVNETQGKDANGEPTLLLTPNSGDATVLEPHFNKAFLAGENSKNTKLGDVYEDVQFPFKKAQVFGDGVDYWYFDSAETTLYLKKNTETASGVPYYLEEDKNNINPSRNSNSGNNSWNTATPKGFLPFNENVVSNARERTTNDNLGPLEDDNKNTVYEELNPNRYNYGFGAKLDIDFSLTDNGKVTGTNDNGSTTQEEPIRFYFSGDDDVWVYIDGQLALDIGGAHGKVSGVLDFSTITSNKVTAYISDVKNNGDEKSSYNQTNPITTLSFRNVATNYYYKQEIDVSSLKLTTGTHRLTMYYMERGMWESNMAVAYNFPDHNEFQVEKVLDLSNVDSRFYTFFENAKLFTMNIRNLATHYGKQDGDTTTPTPSVSVGSAFTAAVNDEALAGNNVFKQGDAPNGTAEDIKATTVRYYAYYDDTAGEYRANRYGRITLNDIVDISNKDYLTFYVYGETESIRGKTTGNLSLDGMYLQLVDVNNKHMGCLAKTDSLSGKTDSANLKNDQWGKIKLKLSELQREGMVEEGFDKTNVKYILIGDSYERNIYFRGFLFSAQPSAGTQIGFAVQQDQIRDYGSAETGKLKNAAGAVYSSNKSIGMSAVDADGEFSLQGGELVTFTDQFRRGSYISLREDANPDLYTTTWTVFENGKAVTSMKEGDTVSCADVNKSLEKQEGTRPDDGRTERYDEATKNSGYTQDWKPSQGNPEDNTIVFRSYSDPDNTDQFTKLKVQFVNTVKVGSLKITKRAAEGEENDLDGKTFTFTILFQNIGGVGLGQLEITQTVECGKTVEITGIPVGTRFRVTETSLPEGVHLKAVDEKNGGEIVADGTAVRGTITETTGDAAIEAIFTNTRRELIDIDLTKNWENADGSTLTDGLPDAIWVQLQRKFESDPDTAWKEVETFELTPEGYNQIWTHKFTGLDKYEPGNESKIYQYRVVEGKCDEAGNFTPAAKNTITWNSWNYDITTSGTVQGDSGSITLTNTRQNPRYTLNITKYGVDETTKVKLGGVEFKLEKLGADGNYVEVTTAMTEDGSGKCSFANLEPGSYRLTETKTADGYSLLAEPIEFTLDSAGNCTLPGGTALGTVTGTAASGYTIALTVNNRKTFELPHTGADAPSLWLLIGLPVLTAGLLALAFCYNKKGGKHS